MTAPGDPEPNPEAREEEQEIVLRLGDILPRVPVHLLKSGPHDTAAPVRFSVEELAEKIARGRVSVPLERMASAYPSVFLDSSAFPGQQQEVPLPLQKLLEQVGLVGPKSSSGNGVPAEQVDQARAEASRIIEANSSMPVPEFATAPPVHSVRIAKAIFTARQILGLFRGPAASSAQPATDEKSAEANGSLSGPQSPAQPEDKKTEPSPDVPLSPPAEPPREAIAKPIPAGHISLQALPIFRLLPASVLRSDVFPPEGVRVNLPLAIIDSQIASGHVEIPIGDFIKALPPPLSESLIDSAETQVWIPLDEIFQNLPKDHLFYMPPLEDLYETKRVHLTDRLLAVAPAENKPEIEENSASDVFSDKMGSKSGADAETVAFSAGQIVDEPTAANSLSGEPPEQAAGSEKANGKPVAPEAASPGAATIAGEPEVVESVGLAPDSPEPAEELVTEKPEMPLKEPELAKTNSKEEAHQRVELQSEPTPKAEGGKNGAPGTFGGSPTAPPSAAEVRIPACDASVHNVEEAASPATTSRAPWMRGFQVPPPRLFSGDSGPSTAAITSAEVLQAEPPTQAPTPEAKQTVDFLAGQSGVFAAAAFVQGAVFASTDFPRKPDLDALREFMGVFIDRAQDGGRRLGWNRTLTISCEQFYLTAVVRDSHFIVALHHDRMLPSLTHDALVEAADELSKAARVSGT